MTPRPSAVRIGLFALVGGALLVTALVVALGGQLLARTEPAVMHFSGSVYGLQVGSPVVFRGVRIGSVQSIGVVHDGVQFTVPVVAALDRDRIHKLHGGSARDDPALSLPALVARGLSAQLADVLLHPEFSYYAGTSRAYREGCIAAGYREALAAAPALRALHAA